MDFGDWFCWEDELDESGADVLLVGVMVLEALMFSGCDRFVWWFEFCGELVPCLRAGETGA